MKKKVIIPIVLLIVIVNPFTLYFFGVMWSNTHPDTGENVKTVKWLPSDAKNISYYKTYSWTAFEFDIPEPSFNQWINKKWVMKPVGKDHSIMRYCSSNGNHRTCSCYQQCNNPKEKCIAVITNGVYDSQRWSNGGGYSVVFDRDAQRAYYQSNPR
jgi:hypothetical protein